MHGSGMYTFDNKKRQNISSEMTSIFLKNNLDLFEFRPILMKFRIYTSTKKHYACGGI